MAEPTAATPSNTASPLAGDNSVYSALSKEIKKLTHSLCPTFSEQQKNELESACLDILSSLSAYPPHQPTPPLDRPQLGQEPLRTLSRNLVSGLREGGLAVDSIVLLCRKMEKIAMDYLKPVEGGAEHWLEGVEQFFSDITALLFSFWVQGETHKYQKKLREANRFILLEKRRYYTIFSRMIEPAFIIDNDMHIVDTNRAFDRFFDRGDKKHLGHLCYDVLGKEVCAACALEEMLGFQKSFAGVEAVIPVRGEMKTVVFSGTFLGDINNEFSGGIISLQDITYSKETERALQESEEKYRSLVENVPDVMWRADQSGNIVYISPNIKKLCGYIPDEFLMEKASDRYAMIHPQDVDRVRSEFSRFFAAQIPSQSIAKSFLTHQDRVAGRRHGNDSQVKFDVQYRVKKKDGTWIWVHDRASEIYHKNGVWYADGVFSDISDLKKAEEELEKHQFRMAELIDERTAELRTANKSLENEVRIRINAEKELLALADRLRVSNQELEQFAHIASHDIKEPLVLVLAFSERLLTKYANNLGEQGREYLVRLAKAAKQMKRLVDDLFELSRISTCSLIVEIVDLTKLVDEVVENLEEHIKRVGGKVDISPLGFLDGDPTQLKQLFQNIIVNALKYSKETKPPTVVIKPGQEGDGFVEIIVEDNGIGFDPVEVEHIFQPFARLHSKSDYEGTGIGLATCKKIVVRHGGDITADSKPGEGARFIVRLPVKPL